ncbi:MAG: periplasmic heavy metal sensor [Hyphomicrobium sp.]
MTLSTNDPNPAAQPPPAPRTRAWVKWLLVGSLALNLLIIGGAVGHKLFGRHGGWRGGERADDFGIMGYARTLDGGQRSSIRKIVQAGKANLKTLREDVRKARMEAAAVLVAEPFDKERSRQALGRIGEAEARIKAAGVATFLDAAETLTPAERNGLIEWWKRRRPHYFRGPPPRPGPDKADAEKADDAADGER